MIIRDRLKKSGDKTWLSVQEENGSETAWIIRKDDGSKMPIKTERAGMYSFQEVSYQNGYYIVFDAEDFATVLISEDGEVIKLMYPEELVDHLKKRFEDEMNVQEETNSRELQTIEDGHLAVTIDSDALREDVLWGYDTLHRTVLLQDDGTILNVLPDGLSLEFFITGYDKWEEEYVRENYIFNNGYAFLSDDKTLIRSDG